MARRRFRLLERAPDPDAPKREEKGAGFNRSLERDGEIRIDESGAVDTDYCPICEAENRAGAKRCYNCKASMGGQDQASIDSEIRGQRAAQQQKFEEEQCTKRDEYERARREEREAREAERAASSGGKVRAWLMAGVILACIFASVSVTLQLFLSAALLIGIPAGAAGALLAAFLTAVVYLRLRPWLEEI